MMTYGTQQSEDTNTHPQKHKPCCRVVDLSEPIIWTCTIFAVVALVYAILSAPAFWLVVSIVLLTLGCLSTWRIRKLGVAFALMESVETLKLENTRLSGEVNRLGQVTDELGDQVGLLEEGNNALASEVSKFEEIVGLLGDNVGDINAAKTGLIMLYENYKRENARYQSNNIFSLFSIVDKDMSGTLSEAEVDRMKHYVRAVYGIELAVPGDGHVTLADFVSLFEKEFAK